MGHELISIKLFLKKVVEYQMLAGFVGGLTGRQAKKYKQFYSHRDQ